MTIPNWAELVKRNYRVIVSQRYAESERDLQILADSLNDLLKEHKDWNNTYAEVDHDEVVYCKLCNYEYSPDIQFDENNKRIETCSWCGGGLTEYAIKKLKEAPNIANILSKL